MQYSPTKKRRKLKQILGRGRDEEEQEMEGVDAIAIFLCFPSYVLYSTLKTERKVINHGDGGSLPSRFRRESLATKKETDMKRKC